jgi:AAA+ superfamily predicted ATPase
MENDILQTLEEMQIEHEKEMINDMLPTVESWVTLDNKNFFFSFKCVDTIPSGLFSMTYNDSQGFGLTKMEYKSEDFFNLPSLPHKKIVSDLNIFWDNKQKFINYNLNPKRGIILHGDSGCGKTSLIYLLVEEIKNRNGISVYFDVPDNWVEIAKLIRKVEKERPILCIIEDIDLVIDKYGEEVFLNFLDGLNSITNVVYVATTNNIERIPDRIKDRPSRFDKKYEIKKPNEEDRKLYFETKLLPEDLTKYNIEKLVKDTKNFTMAHLKEVFISLYILDNEYKEVIERLKKSKITEPSKIGFDLNDEY